MKTHSESIGLYAGDQFVFHSTVYKTQIVGEVIFYSFITISPYTLRQKWSFLERNICLLKTGTRHKETHNVFLELQSFIQYSLKYTKQFLKQISAHVFVHERIKCHISISILQVVIKIVDAIFREILVAAFRTNLV